MCRALDISLLRDDSTKSTLLPYLIEGLRQRSFYKQSDPVYFEAIPSWVCCPNGKSILHLLQSGL